MVSTPAAPDPVATADAQSTYNTNTALSTQLVNMVNQVNPYGSVTYDQTGTNSFTGADGKTYTLPSYTQTTSYTPQGQAIQDSTMDAQKNLADTAANQSAAVESTLSTPYSFTNNDASNWAYDLASQRILPQQQQNQEALKTQLINSGIRPGTTAYTNEMQRLTNANSDQLNQLALNGQSQAYDQSLSTRNQSLNELNALLSGSQLTNPGTASSATTQTSVAGTDYSGDVNSTYATQSANSNAMLGGLFGLAGTAATAGIKYSDRRVKVDVQRVGALDNGLPVYSYRYAWGGPVEIGLIAQDVENVKPEAVTEVNGIKAVDYAEAVR